VLHVTRIHRRGMLALCRTAMRLSLNVEARKLELCVSEMNSAADVSLDAATPVARGGYQQLYIEHVLQADQGADLDSVGCRGADVPRRSLAAITLS